MCSKILFQTLCLSLVLTQIRSFVNSGHYYPIQSFVDSPEHKEQEHWRHHPNRHHYSPRDVEGHIERASDHELSARVLPLFQTLLNRKYEREGRIETNDDSNYDSRVRGTAQISSVVHTKITETIIGNPGQNDSQIITKVLEQDAKSDAVFELNSNLDLITDRKSVNKSKQEFKPNDNQIIDLIEPASLNLDKKLLPIKMKFRTLSKQLRRMKRDDSEAGTDVATKAKNSWDKIVDSVKTAAKHVKNVVDEHIVKPVKKKFDEFTKNMDTDKKNQTRLADEHDE